MSKYIKMENAAVVVKVARVRLDAAKLTRAAADEEYKGAKDQMKEATKAYQDAVDEHDPGTLDVMVD